MLSNGEPVSRSAITWQSPPDDEGKPNAAQDYSSSRSSLHVNASTSDHAGIAAAGNVVVEVQGHASERSLHHGHSLTSKARPGTILQEIESTQPMEGLVGASLWARVWNRKARSEAVD